MNENLIFKLVNWDCLLEMQNIESNSIDCIITDPPYKILWNGFKARGWFLWERWVITDIENMKDGFDFKILEEFFRVCKKANFYIYCNKDLLFDLIVYFKNRPEKLFIDLLTEHITNPTPFCNNTFLNDTDYILYIRESWVMVRWSYHQKKKYEIKSTNTEDKKLWKHPTCKYVKFIEKYITNSSNEWEVILDPFMWSWTTWIACKNLNRWFIWIELNKEYFKVAENRILNN